eukprot:1136547-Pyramimonas_sp.AAC.1
MTGRQPSMLTGVNSCCQQRTPIATQSNGILRPSHALGGDSTLARWERAKGLRTLRAVGWTLRAIGCTLRATVWTLRAIG